MDLFRLDQILTLTAFLGALGGVWLFVIRYRAGLGARLHGGRRLRVTETAALGPTDRALILSVDGAEYLLICAKGAPPLLRALEGGQ